MKILNTLIHKIMGSYVKHILHYMEMPMPVQERLLTHLLKRAKGTTWGKQYDYHSIQNIETFQERVPVSTYEDLKPYVQQMMQGEANVLWPGKFSWFSKSSGTTNDKSKYIPVSKENLAQCHIKGPRDVMAIWYYSNPNTQLFANGKGLVMGGTHQLIDAEKNIRAGDISGIMLQTMPFYAKYFHTPDVATALMPDWEAKIEKMVHQVIKENVTNINGVPTWTMVLLKRILEVTGKDNILEVFPDFEYYGHGGVSFEPYREQFKRFFPAEHIQYRNMYNASEGFFATQFAKEDDGMLLLLDNGIFYEFVPVEELKQEQPKALTVEEVVLDTNYAMIISTNAGLWRYNTGDTVQFTSLYPHKIQITGRTKHFINVFGEEVMVANTDKALAQTCMETDAKVCEYTVAPRYLSLEQKGRHEWAIEFEKAPLNLNTFAQLLDQNLQKLNSDYEAKRYKDIALENLVVHQVSRGTFHKWLRQKGKYGGQSKVPRLFNKRTYLDEILKVLP
ncbi:MAG: GH3 auxin-responsive promoter family protein [Aureispira sp.]|nr:GH3 auxin-responsive promoter family protein [Aureispira sp.]